MQLNARDRLQPSLLDRLLDDAPGETREGNDGRMLNRQQLRSAVLRDLSWLFNAIRAEPEPASERSAELARWAAAPHARTSVLNFGMPALAGSTLSTLDAHVLEHNVVEAIRTFEPRIEARSIEVDVRLNAGDTHHNSLEIEIRGRLWSQPVPLELLLAADMDLETGHTRVRER